jgi:hypothetical protein
MVLSTRQLREHAPAARHTVLTPDLKPLGEPQPTIEAAITAAEKATGKDWRWMIERGFRVSQS